MHVGFCVFEYIIYSVPGTVGALWNILMEEYVRLKQRSGTSLSGQDRALLQGWGRAG